VTGADVAAHAAANTLADALANVPLDAFEHALELARYEMWELHFARAALARAREGRK
jgi:hypothetical protein